MDRIFDHLRVAKLNFWRLLDDFLRIQKLLEGTPNPGDVATAKKAFAHANRHYLDVQGALKQVEAQLTLLGEDFDLTDDELQSEASYGSEPTSK